MPAFDPATPFRLILKYPPFAPIKHGVKFLAVVSLVAAAVATVLLPSSAQPVAAASRVDGVVTDLTWYISRADMDRSISLMQQAGVKTVRANINWSSLEPNAKGAIDSWWLTEIDYAVSKAQAAGIEILMPVSDEVPYWASADPARYSDASGNHWNKAYKPRVMQDYADFFSAIVKRYAPKGVHAYEVWNEPNYSRFWPSGPSAADYVTMLKAAYPAIKAADPSAVVLTGGVSRSDYNFVQQMYAAGAKGYFDAIAIHPYTRKNDPTVCTAITNMDNFCSIEQVRNVMVNNGDSAKNIWLTEFGWSTASTAGDGVTEAVQADFLTKAFNKLASYPYVVRAYWYAGRNLYWGANNQSDIESNYGLTRVDFSLKPSYTAFKNLHTTATPTTTTSTTVKPTTTTSTTVKPTTTTSTTVKPTTTTTSPLDRTAPTIGSLGIANIKSTTATVTWTTNEASDSVVEYWVTGGAVRTVTNTSRVTAHTINLSGLTRYTTYNVRVKSKDAAGNVATSATKTFRTTYF